MIIQRIEGWTRELGKSQGYLGLALRDVVVACTVNGEVPAMQTAWEPTPEQLRRMNEGRPVILTVLGTEHPPVMLDVAE